MKDSDYSDEELLALFHAEGGQQRHYAFNLLVGKYQRRLYQHIRRILIDHQDTDDVLQETFIKTWHHLEGFRKDSQLFTWLYRVATNEALGFLRKKRRRFFIPVHDVEAELQQKLSADSLVKPGEIELKFQKALLQLPEKQRLVFTMRYYDELPYTDISAILGTSVGALKASYHLAVKKMEKIMTEN